MIGSNGRRRQYGGRSVLIALVSSVVFFAVIWIIASRSSTWPLVQRDFFDGPTFWRYLPVIAGAFVTNIQLFLMAEALVRLAQLTGADAWRNAAERLIRAFTGAPNLLPQSPLLLAAAEIQKLPLETRGATSLYCTTLRLADLQGNGGQCSVGSDGGDSQVGEDTALGLAQHNL